MLDVSADFLLFDGQEPISYQRIGPGGVSLGVAANVPALMRAVTGSVFGGSPQAPIDVTTWHIPVASLPWPPARGDKIVSAVSGTWSVESDSIETFNSRYKIITKRIG